MNEDPGNAGREDLLLAAVRSWSAEARAGEAAHPTSDVLLAYHERELGGTEAEGVREHLAVCAECAQRALDLEPLSRRALADGAAEGSATAAEAWQSTRRAFASEGLLGAADAPPPVAEHAPWRSRQWLFGPRLAYAAAAVFCLTTVGLSLRLADARRALSELEGPRANVLLVDLQPLGAGPQRAEGSPPPQVAAAGEDLVLILHLLDPGSYARYRVEAFPSPAIGAKPDPEERPAWSTDSLRRSPEGDFTVLLPRRLPAAGDVRIRLYGMDGTRPELLAEYDLRFAAPAGSGRE